MSVLRSRLLLRVPEVAEALSISRSQAYELIRRGIIPAIKLGDSVRVPQAELEQMVRREIEAARGGLWN